MIRILNEPHHSSGHALRVHYSHTLYLPIHIFDDDVLRDRSLMDVPSISSVKASI